MCDSCKASQQNEYCDAQDNWERFAGQLMLLAIVLICVCLERQAYAWLWTALAAGIGGVWLLWRVKLAKHRLKQVAAARVTKKPMPGLVWMASSSVD